MALDATVGGATANAYCDETTASTYFTGHLYAAPWVAADTPTREAALQHATRLIDAYGRWEGTIASSDQALAWPRSGVLDRDGRELSTDEIPDAIVVATCEMALALLGENLQAEQRTGISSVTAGDVAVVFNPYDRKKKIPESVTAMVPYTLGYFATSNQSVRLVRT